jgi:Histidine kinase-, DNA gyrase B-, and HSP90-like ATPase
MTTYTHPNSPNPAKLIEALRHLGYDNYTAISDLIDNCWDANAKNVRVLTRSAGTGHEIIIADDGAGMSREVLAEAIKLGSMVDKDIATDLGKFGMGLVTASLSIARQTIVLTKTENGELLKAISDVDEVVRTNQFVSHLDKASTQDATFFKEMLENSKSGTIVILRKCDNLQDKNASQFGKTLGKHIARIFREFMVSDERCLYVNGVKLERIDPLKWDNTETDHFCDEPLEVKHETENGPITDTIRIKLAIVTENPATGQKEKDLSMRSQGFYVMRNHREICEAESLGFFVKHNSLNRFRGEIHFSGVLDDFMGVSFTKNGVRLGQSARDQLERFLKGQIETIRKRLQKKQRIEVPEDVTEVHQGAEKEIHKKSKLLLTPESVAPEPSERKTETGHETKHGKKEVSESQKDQKPSELKEAYGFATSCRFEAMAMGEGGVIYEPEQVGKTIIVRWNSDHPFYKRFVLDNIQDKGMLAAADYLVYSLACAELMYSKDDDNELVQNFKAAISANLRVLLG